MSNRHYVPANILETSLAALSVPRARARNNCPTNPQAWLRIDLRSGICTLKSPIFLAEIHCSLLEKGDSWSESVYYLTIEGVENCLDPENCFDGRTIGEEDLRNESSFTALEIHHNWIQGMIKRERLDALEYLEANGEPLPAPSDDQIDMEAVKALQAFLYSYSGRACLASLYTCTRNDRLEDSILMQKHTGKSHDFATLKLKY